MWARNTWISLFYKPMLVATFFSLCEPRCLPLRFSEFRFRFSFCEQINAGLSYYNYCLFLARLCGSWHYYTCASMGLPLGFQPFRSGSVLAVSLHNAIWFLASSGSVNWPVLLICLSYWERPKFSQNGWQFISLPAWLVSSKKKKNRNVGVFSRL